MKFRLSAFAAALVCCISCVEMNPLVGGSLIPIENTSTVCVSRIPIQDIELKAADSLSGYNKTKIIIGSIRDELFGLTTRESVVTLVPVFLDKDTTDISAFIRDSLDVHYRNFHFAVAADTNSVADVLDRNILQNVRVYALEEALNPDRDFDINDVAGHVKADRGTLICKGTPIINGHDSLSFNFTDDFAKKFFTLAKEDLRSYGSYVSKYPGILLSTEQASAGGRINMFELQLDAESQGNYALLTFDYTGHENDGKGGKKEVAKDSSFLFYLSPTDIYDVDSLMTNSAKNSYPQYCLNLTHQEKSASLSGKATDSIIIEGGGGIKPVITAKTLRDLTRETLRERIAAEYGITEAEVTDEQISAVVINKATISLPFEYTDADYEEMYKMPVRLSPTCRMSVTDTTSGKVGPREAFRTISFNSLTDSSNSNENQGDIDRHNLAYTPDITHHIQELIRIKDSDSDKMKKVIGGDYDVWLFIMAYETVTTTTSSDSDISEYYQYLAYQSYYNQMYGGGYGYGGYGYGDPYSNYYSYMMAAMYAGGSSTSTSSELQLDKGRYYKAFLNGPSSTNSRKPELKLTYSIPNIEK